MPQTVVVYRSISGFTKKYALWIAEELSADLYDSRKIDAKKLLDYDVIVFGGSLHAVGINGLSLIKNNKQRLADKKIVVFAVGASPSTKNLVEVIKKHNFIEMPNLKLFYLRGGFNFAKLDLTNKILMMLFKVRIKMKKEKTPDEVGMLTAYSKPLDCTRKENIKAIVEYARSLDQFLTD